MAKPPAPAGVSLAPLPRVLVPHPHVRCDTRVLGGSPHVADSRVPVRRLWAWHRAGVSIDTLLKRYPRLGPARVLDALAFAYDNRDVVDADLAREMSVLEAAGTRPVGLRPMQQQSLPFPDEGSDSDEEATA
ncbi:MAG: DUF433 domain-containing protein [Deltaproteobacteria bacterium]|nr:DUF433 domain-containing protein [Deltaproteobacteria bacterium]